MGVKTLLCIDTGQLDQNLMSEGSSLIDVNGHYFFLMYLELSGPKDVYFILIYF